MNSSLFNFRIGIHTILLAITSAVFVWTLSREYLIVTRISLGLLWVGQIIMLIYFVNKTNRDLLLFLQSFEFQDDTLTFNKKKKLPFKPVYDEFNRIIESFREIKLQKEMEQLYFQYSIRHVDTGLISFDSNGNVELFNDAAKRLLNIEYATSIQSLERAKPGMIRKMQELEPGRRDMVKIARDNEILFLSLRAAEFKLKDKQIKLISLQNIKNELDEQEMDSWQKLIRVLTHEIVNSVSPVTLLSSTLTKIFEEDGKPVKPGELDDTQIENTIKGLKAINKRSQGLSGFVESYKSLTKISDPVLETIKIRALFDHVLDLMKPLIAEYSIKIDAIVKPRGLELEGDEKLLEQVLINLIKNAIEAGKDSADLQIALRAYGSGQSTVIEVADNGPGIPKDVIENVFVPFFTTKKEGSGIGLSLSRQILRKLGGNLKVTSAEGNGATFVISI